MKQKQANNQNTYTRVMCIMAKVTLIVPFCRVKDSGM